MRITTLAEYGVICALHLARRRADGPVTGREIADLRTVFDRFDLFDLIVGENGGLLYWPSNDREKLLCQPPPPGFEPVKRATPTAAPKDSELRGSLFDQPPAADQPLVSREELAALFEDGPPPARPGGAGDQTSQETNRSPALLAREDQTRSRPDQADSALTAAPGRPPQNQVEARTSAQDTTGFENPLVARDWNDAKQKTSIKGSLHGHLSPNKLKFKSIAKHTHLSSSNVTGALKAHKVVILAGSYTPPGSKSTATHYMLATLYDTTPSNGLHAVVALDPWTGTQVEISPSTKKVVTPGFPLTDFVVTQYEAFDFN